MSKRIHIYIHTYTYVYKYIYIVVYLVSISLSTNIYTYTYITHMYIYIHTKILVWYDMIFYYIMRSTGDRSRVISACSCRSHQQSRRPTIRPQSRLCIVCIRKWEFPTISGTFTGVHNKGSLKGSIRVL